MGDLYWFDRSKSEGRPSGRQAPSAGRQSLNGLGKHLFRTFPDHVFPVILVWIEGFADCGFDGRRVGPAWIAEHVQPIVGTQPLENVERRIGAELEAADGDFSVRQG